MTANAHFRTVESPSRDIIDTAPKMLRVEETQTFVMQPRDIIETAQRTRSQAADFWCAFPQKYTTAHKRRSHERGKLKVT